MALSPRAARAKLDAACKEGNTARVWELLGMGGPSAPRMHPCAETALLAALYDQYAPEARLWAPRTSPSMRPATVAFLGACHRGHLPAVRLLLTLTRDCAVHVHAGGEEAFIAACTWGHLEVVRFLLTLRGPRAVNVHAQREAAFRSACKMGKESVVDLLLSLAGSRRIDVHAGENAGIWSTIRRGHVGVARQLLALTGERTVQVDWDAAFGLACGEGHVRMVQYLMTLEGPRRVNVPANINAAFANACSRYHVGMARFLLGLEGQQAVDLGTVGPLILANHCVHDGMMLALVEAGWRRGLLPCLCSVRPDALRVLFKGGRVTGRQWLRLHPQAVAAWCVAEGDAGAGTLAALRDAHWDARRTCVLARRAARRGRGACSQRRRTQ